MGNPDEAAYWIQYSSNALILIFHGHTTDNRNNCLLVRTFQTADEERSSFKQLPENYDSDTVHQISFQSFKTELKND